MRKRYKFPLIIIAIIIILIICLLLVPNFYKKKDDVAKPVEIKVLDSIDKYGYSLDERDSKLMKSTYEELRDILNSETIDDEKYANCIAKLFVIDLWTMNNKTNKYDVGSTEYVLPDNVDNFKIDVESTIYKDIENNNGGSRKQELPAVKSIEIIETSKDKFTIGEDIVDCFVVKLAWEYEQDLGYEDNASITLVKNDDKIYVVEYVSGE